MAVRPRFCALHFKQEQMIIFKAMVEQAKLHIEKQKIAKQMATLKRCGLEKEAKALLAGYNGIVADIKALDEKVREQQMESAAALLCCFVAADLATTTADMFADVCEKVNYGANKADNEFVKLMKMNAETSTTRWNEVVKIFDEGANDFNMSMFYASFSDKIVDTIVPKIKEMVWEAMTETKEGKKYFCRNERY